MKTQRSLTRPDPRVARAPVDRCVSRSRHRRRRRARSRRHAAPATRHRGRRGRGALQLQEAHGPGRRHVQAGDRAQGPHHVGDGLHVQELHPRSAHRVDGQEGHGHRAEQDERAAEAYNVFLAALSTMGLTVVPKGNVYRIVESRDREERDGADPEEGRAGEPGPDGPLHPAAVVHADRDAARARSTRSARRPATWRPRATSSSSPTTRARCATCCRSRSALDIPGNNEGIYTIPVKNADATQLATKINEILGVTAGGGGRWRRRRRRSRRRQGRRRRRAAAGRSDDGGGGVPSKILVDDRTNTLIVVSSEAGYLRVQGARRSPRHRRSIPRAAARSASTRSRTRSPRSSRRRSTNALSGQAQPQPRGGQPGQPPRGRRPAARARRSATSAARSRARSASSATSRRTR